MESKGKLVPKNERILRAAEAVFSKKGYRQATLDEIVKIADTGKGTVYKYFNNKENAKAEKELMNFIENGTPHQYWLARGFILLADIYISQNDDFQARQYLTSLQNNYKGDDDIAGMIENRLGKLKN